MQPNKTKPIYSKNLRVAGILDELSEKFFLWDCIFINLDFNKWKSQIEELQPHILFVESIWNGYKKTWRGKIKPKISSEFEELIDWCNKNNVKTIFWNKEDPIHFLTFINVANYFEIVLTTDFDCIPLYRRLLKHDRVYVLPFASSPRLFNPIEKYHRKDALCFAGSYYRKQKERTEDFHNIMDMLIDSWEIDIYDRNPYPDHEDYMYPPAYQKFIRGTLPVDKIDIAYKSYLYALTLNIVKYSSTMEARRVFELLNSNTLIISNHCSGIKNMLGDLVLFEDENYINRLHELKNNNQQYKKTILQGLRKVLLEHTYENRMNFLYYLTYGIKPKNTLPSIVVYSDVKNEAELNRIISMFNSQTYANKYLYIFYYNNIFTPQTLPLSEKVFILPINLKNINLFNAFDYSAYFNAENYYGKNYILDMALATKYTNTTTVGKGAYYFNQNNKFEVKHLEYRYKPIIKVKKDRCMLNIKDIEGYGWLDLSPNEYIDYLPCMSIDEYNFCENYNMDSCNEVDDIVINTGISIDQIYNLSLSENLSKIEHYEYQLELKGESLFNVFKKYFEFDSNILDIVYNQSTQSIYFTTKFNDSKFQFFLNYKFDANKYSNDFTILHVFLDSIFINKNKAEFYCTLYNSKDEQICSYFLHSFGNTSVNVKKEDLAYFKISIEGQGEFALELNEIIINPKTKESINLKEIGDINEYYTSN